MVGGKRILAISAHPDDAEYGCGGYMQRFNERLILVINTMGRAQEAAKGAEKLGADITMVGNNKTPERELIKLMTNLINSFEPDVICTHHKDDYHQDHRKAALCTLSACREYSGLILSYCAPSSRPFMPNYFVELSDAEYEKKLEALAAHESQAQNGYLTRPELDAHFGYWGMAYRGLPGWVEPFIFQRCTIGANNG